MQDLVCPRAIRGPVRLRKRDPMIGAIAGDVIGSVHEGAGTKTKDFPLFAEDCRFTDDTVLTVAVAEQILRAGEFTDLFHDYFHCMGRRRGGRFQK
jgi:ADP-ribosylglycohydrolase